MTIFSRHSLLLSRDQIQYIGPAGIWKTVRFPIYTAHPRSCRIYMQIFLGFLQKACVINEKKWTNKNFILEKPISKGFQTRDFSPGFLKIFAYI